MSDDPLLREKVREAICAGRLPTRDPERTWGGRGCGARCTVCGEVLRPDEVEIELEFASSAAGNGQGAGNGNGYRAVNGNGHAAGNGNGHNGRATHGPGADKRSEDAHVHLRCFTAWELARREMEVGLRSPGGLPAGTEGGTILNRDRAAYKDESGGSR